jgi:hypothetical protein
VGSVSCGSRALGWSAPGRFCCKSPKIPGDDFFENKEAKLSSPINMAPRPLAKSPVSFSLGDEVPHIFIRESHQRPRKILISVENDFCNKIGTEEPSQACPPMSVD